MAPQDPAGQTRRRSTERFATSSASVPGAAVVVGSAETSVMIVRRRDRSPLARTRSAAAGSGPASSLAWKRRVRSFARVRFWRFFFSATRTFFFFATERHLAESGVAHGTTTGDRRLTTEKPACPFGHHSRSRPSCGIQQPEAFQSRSFAHVKATGGETGVSTAAARGAGVLRTPRGCTATNQGHADREARKCRPGAGVDRPGSTRPQGRDDGTRPGRRCGLYSARVERTAVAAPIRVAVGRRLAEDLEGASGSTGGRCPAARPGPPLGAA